MMLNDIVSKHVPRSFHIATMLAKYMGAKR